jgi:hypothetical protein
MVDPIIIRHVLSPEAPQRALIHRRLLFERVNLILVACDLQNRVVSGPGAEDPDVKEVDVPLQALDDARVVVDCASRI